MAKNPRTVCIGVCGAVILALAAYLAFGPKPWDSGVTAAVAQGKDIKTTHYAVSGEWFGAAVNLLLALAMLAACRWLTRPLSAGFASGRAGVAAGSRRFFLGATVLAVTLGAILNAPRLDSSLWGDEEYTMKRFVVGDYLRSENGTGEEIRFRPAPWIDTFFLYKNPNNHFLNSLLARAVHGTFFRPSDAPGALHFSETLIRLPAFVAGLFGIWALGWCLAVIGFPRAGILAMFLLAIHPWFTRYGVDARGYAFVFPFFPASLGCLVKAVRLGKWRYFFLFALCETLLFYAYPGTLYLLLPLNIAFVATIAFGTIASRPDKITLLARWFAANMAAAMTIIQLLAPTLKPMGEYLQRSRAQGETTLAWVADNLSYLATGLPWASWDKTNPLCEHLSAYDPLPVWLMLGAVTCLLVLGIIRFATASRQTLLILIALLLPWPLFVAHSVAGGRLLYHWYMVITLPGLILLLAAGLESIAARFPGVRARNLGGAVLLIVYGAGFLSLTSLQRDHLRSLSVEPLRESAKATRRALNPDAADFGKDITAGFCMATRGYDPFAYLFKKDDPKGFQQLMNRAIAEEKPLHVNFALPGLARVEFPGIMALIENTAFFEPLPPFYGLDPPCTRLVYRLRMPDPQPAIDR